MKVEYDFTTTVEELLRQLRRRVASGRASFRERADLEEWEHYASHRSPATAVKVRRAAVFHDSRAFFKFLTPERLRILDELRSGKSFESLNELARSLGRDPKNVYEDVKALEAKGLVRVEKRNPRRSVPRSRVERIVITM